MHDGKALSGRGQQATLCPKSGAFQACPHLKLHLHRMLGVAHPCSSLPASAMMWPSRPSGRQSMVHGWAMAAERRRELKASARR